MENKSVLDMIGNTPLVAIRNLNPNRKVQVYAKLEKGNPGGSIKDRAALYMIEQAEKRGELTRDKTIIEATSGNTGIGIALVAAAKGYKVLLVMSEGASEERKKILRALGAELLFTPANQGTDGAIELVYEMVRKDMKKFFLADQYNNEDNILAHYYGTGEEIWKQTEGRVTMVVATLGTSGTAMGISRRLKEYNDNISIVGVEPYLRHRIQGLKNMTASYRPGIFNKLVLDEKVNILDEDAFEMARRLSREEGLFVGMSSGAAMHVAIEKAKKLESGTIVAVLPDGGDRYLSTELFADRERTSLSVYNVLPRKKEYVRPINAREITLHSCGPTVHEVPHLGVYRRFVFADLVARFLEFKGYSVKHVSNIIDISDRAISGAEKCGLDMKTFTSRNTDRFMEDIRKLNIRKESEYPLASHHVDEMVKLVDGMIQKGYAYEKLRSVYFDISKMEDYGTLSRIKPDTMRQSTRVELDEYEKDSPGDFVLLKRTTLAELKKGIYYKTKWGNVRPSWHLECATISMTRLSSETFDIHVSGSDIVFPHCENVMALGKAVTGKPLANYWLSAEVVMNEGKKMSRSLNNHFTIGDIEKRGFTGKELRYFLLSSHYRKHLNFSFGALETAQNTVRRLNSFTRRLLEASPGPGFKDTDQYIYDLRRLFSEAMEDDFNISEALATLFDFVRKINKPLSEQLISLDQKKRILDLMKSIDSIIGVMDFDEKELDEEAKTLIAKRDSLRRERRWSEADEIRNSLEEKGIILEDTTEGTAWKIKS